MQVASITGKPRLFHILDVMGVRVFSERVTTTILTVEPMMVPLPPKPAPKANAHQSGPISRPVAPNPWITGIMAIVIGILSTIADNNATIQMMITPNSTGGMACALLSNRTNISRTPAASNPPTSTNNAAKKNSTLHSMCSSIFSMSGRIQTKAAPIALMAINAGLICKKWEMKKSRMAVPKTISTF